MFQRVFNLQKVTPRPFLPAIDWVWKLEAKFDKCWVGGSGHPSTTLKLNGRDTVPKMTLSYFLKPGRYAFVPKLLILFAYLFFEFRWGSGFLVPTLFLKWEFHWPCIDRSRCRCYATLASATWLFYKAEPLRQWWDVMIWSCFLFGWGSPTPIRSIWNEYQ